MRKKYIKNIVLSTLITGSLAFCGASAQAGLLDVFDTSWTEFQPAGEDGVIEPGVGGQDFDAEYLLYKINGDILSLGLQAGFDLYDGHVDYGGKDYYAGDLALSFDGSTSSDSSSYEYAVDFGLYTKDYNDQTVGGLGTGTAGTDDQGLYQVSDWNTDVYTGYTSSNPFAMNGGTLVTDALISNTTNPTDTAINDSYYRIVALDLTKILGIDWASSGFMLDAHWTMSCGNDAIDGAFDVAPVPEPATMLLFGTGLIGLAGVARRRSNKK